MNPTEEEERVQEEIRGRGMEELVREVPWEVLLSWMDSPTGWVQLLGAALINLRCGTAVDTARAIRERVNRDFPLL